MPNKFIKPLPRFGVSKMNKERIEQCKKDIEALQKELAKLEKGVPIISFATFESKNNRVVINFNRTMLNAIKHNVDIKQLIITPYGGCVGARQDFKLPSVYSDQTPIFGEIFSKASCYK